MPILAPMNTKTLSCQACQEDHVPHVCERCGIDYFELLGPNYDEHVMIDKYGNCRCICTHCRTHGETELWAESVDEMDISEPEYSCHDDYRCPSDERLDADMAQGKWEQHR